MKKLFTILFSVILLLNAGACSSNDKFTDSNPENPNMENMKVKITVSSAVFTATLENNETAKAFSKILPMTINMADLNRNEKYYDLSNSLPRNASNPGTIQNGDIMLWGSNTVVLFYKTFSTSYSYTRIGVIDDPSGLESALGTGNIVVTFELMR